MVEFSVDVDFDEGDLRETLAEQYAVQIEHGAINCETDDCDSESFDAEIWTNDNGGFEGAAFCRECNKRFELELDDSQVQEELDELEQQIKDLENAF